MFFALLRPRYQVSVYRTIGPLVWIYICLFLTALFHPKFMINVMTLILM